MNLNNNKHTTMKKQYITPAIETVNIELANMIAGSVRIYNGNSGGDDGEGGYNPEKSLSNERRGGWGDLWE